MHGKAGAEGWRLRYCCSFCREEEKELRRDSVRTSLPRLGKHKESHFYIDTGDG